MVAGLDAMGIGEGRWVDRGRGGGQLAGMLEDAEIERLFVRLDAPGDGVVALDVDPPDEVGLELLSVGIYFLFSPTNMYRPTLL
jgi:hypothetical protein